MSLRAFDRRASQALESAARTCVPVLLASLVRSSRSRRRATRRASASGRTCVAVVLGCHSLAAPVPGTVPVAAAPAAEPLKRKAEDGPVEEPAQRRPKKDEPVEEEALPPLVEALSKVGRAVIASFLDDADAFNKVCNAL